MKTLFLLLIVTLAGCMDLPPAPKTKADLRAFQLGTVEHLRGSSADLVRYWDEHAKKMHLDGANVTSFDIRQGAAQINVQGRVPYILIELVDDGHGGSNVTTYSWGNTAGRAREWLTVLRAGSAEGARLATR